MNRRGFALLTVLWLITALSALVGLALAGTRLGFRTTANRVVLARGYWAAEACLAIAQKRWTERGLVDTTTIDLGRGTWCRWAVEDLTARVNVNTAERGVLEQVTPYADSILVRRRGAPFVAVAELPGLDPRILTVDGPGVVNLSVAPREVLRALPGMTPEAVDRVVGRRDVGRPYSSLDALVADLSPPARSELLARYADLARIAVFTAPELRVIGEGWVAGEAPRARVEVLVVPLPDRLAVVRRRVS
jgi:hypothetical protein